MRARLRFVMLMKTAATNPILPIPTEARWVSPGCVMTLVGSLDSCPTPIVTLPTPIIRNGREAYATGRQTGSLSLKTPFVSGVLSGVVKNGGSSVWHRHLAGEYIGGKPVTRFCRGLLASGLGSWADQS